jgi:hypothetical protein
MKAIACAVALVFFRWPLPFGEGAMAFIASVNKGHHQSKVATNQGLP